MTKTFLLTLTFAASLAVLPAAAQDLAKDAPTQDVTTQTQGRPDTGAGASNPAAEQAPISVSEEQPAAAPAAAGHEAAPAEDGGHTHAAPAPRDVRWSFEGPFGTFDRASMQRGFQIYKNVCAACHSLNRLAYRNLTALGYSEAQIKTIAAEASITDGPNDEGEMFERPGRPSDHFKAPFANDNAARYANNGALPPDLSLIIRARANGSDYVYSVLTGYGEAPAGVTIPEGMHYNEYFPGHQIAMPQPLSEGIVTYEDGTEATVDQMAKDVVTFLTWASEPAMEIRKQTGLKVMLFLIVFAGLMYATKRRVWKDIH